MRLHPIHIAAAVAIALAGTAYADKGGGSSGHGSSGHGSAGAPAISNSGPGSLNSGPGNARDRMVIDAIEDRDERARELLEGRNDPEHRHKVKKAKKVKKPKVARAARDEEERLEDRREGLRRDRKTENSAG